MQSISSNRYEYLRQKPATDLPDTKPETRLVSTDTREQVYIHTAMPAPGVYTAGYSVYWKAGRLSQKIPSAKDGVFQSKREAELYTIGFFIRYIRHFTESNRQAILQEEAALSQQQLF